MTADDRNAVAGDDGGATFEDLGPKLTIYALANGMDLKKQAAVRRLEWYHDGQERGIAIEATGSGTVSIRALAWTRNTPGAERSHSYRSAVPAEELGKDLSTILEGGMVAANTL
jgi:hypothetical protein